jgi:hypothetical protein
MAERTTPGVRKSGRLKSLYCSLEPSEWSELQKYKALDRLSMTQLCNQLLRDYITACRKHYAKLSEPD